jgi:hypothetical protein
MRVVEKLAPVMAAVSAVATLACCLPLGGVALLGFGGILGVAAQYQSWLLPLSGGLLLVSGVLIWRARRLCQRTSRASVIILAASALVVVLVLAFPQLVAGFLTDWLS